MKSLRIIVFAKAPEPGFAKTRLIPVLGAQGAADLARQMLLHTLNEALAADIGTVELCATPALNDVAWREVVLPGGIATSDQGEGDLGARMARAARRAIEQGERVLLVGTDCVEMSAELLQQAGQALDDHEAVIHCTADGGYALLGLTRFSLLLFGDIPWSTGEVSSLTIARLGQLGWTLHVGPMLHDVDEPHDLDRLPPHWSVDVAA
jgi:hypothetical protein